MNESDENWRIDVRDTNLHISEIRDTDVSSLVRACNDRDIYKNTLRIPCPYEASHAESYLKIIAATTQSHGHARQYAIRTADGILIGAAGLEGEVQGHQAEIGYWLARPFRGRGLMPKIVTTLVEYGIDELSLIRITAHVFASNTPSIRVLEKCGFEYEGFLRKRYEKDGKYLDARLYATVR